MAEASSAIGMEMRRAVLIPIASNRSSATTRQLLGATGHTLKNGTVDHVERMCRSTRCACRLESQRDGVGACLRRAEGGYSRGGEQRERVIGVGNDENGNRLGRLTLAAIASTIGWTANSG